MKELKHDSAPNAELSDGALCPKCGAVVNSEQGFCPTCGCDLVQARAEAVRLKQKKKKQKRLIVLCSLGVLLIAVVLVSALYLFPEFIIPTIRLNKANSALADGDYSSAIAFFEKSGRVKAEDEYYTAYQYSCGMVCFSDANYTEAATFFISAADYANAKTLLHDCGEQLLLLEKYEDAIEVFSMENTSEAQDGINYANGMLAYQDENYSSAISELSAVSSGKYDVDTLLPKINYEYAMSLYNSKKYKDAKAKFNVAGDYEDAKTYAVGCDVMLAEATLSKDGIAAGITAYDALDPSISFDGINVAERQNLLHSLKSFADFEGTYQARSNYIESKNTSTSGRWSNWYIDEVEPLQYVQISTTLNKDGTVNIIGKVAFFRFTNYSAFSSSCEATLYTTNFNAHSVSEIPVEFDVDSNTTLTYSDGEFKLKYYVKENYSVYSYNTYLSEVSYSK